MASRKRVDVLVGPPRPLVAGGEYDPAFHTYELLRDAGLGADYSGLTLANKATFVVRLAPMEYD